MEYKILGYKYLTKQDAVDAVTSCNQYYNITRSENKVTSTWCEYEKDVNDIYYITHNKTLIPVLGEPYEFTIEIEESLI